MGCVLCPSGYVLHHKTCALVKSRQTQTQTHTHIDIDKLCKVGIIHQHVSMHVCMAFMLNVKLVVFSGFASLVPFRSLSLCRSRPLCVSKFKSSCCMRRAHNSSAATKALGHPDSGVMNYLNPVPAGRPVGLAWTAFGRFICIKLYTLPHAAGIRDGNARTLYCALTCRGRDLAPVSAPAYIRNIPSNCDLAY